MIARPGLTTLKAMGRSPLAVWEYKASECVLGCLKFLLWPAQIAG